MLDGFVPVPGADPAISAVFVGVQFRTGPDVDVLLDWVPDEAVRKAILVDNPAVLYGFD